MPIQNVKSGIGRVYRERILRVVNQQLNRSREEWIYPEEAVFYERISPMCRDQITPEVLIAYCVFRVYYPIDLMVSTRF